MLRLKWLGAGLLLPSSVLAHVTSVPPHEEPGWTLAPSIVVPVVTALVLFVAGTWRLQRRSRLGRSELQRHSCWFAAGWLTLAAAALTPLHAAGERSFALHMLEHELLMLVAAPFLVLAQPLQIMVWAFGPRTRKVLGALIRTRAVAAAWQGLQGPFFATLLQASALWLWHVPRLFQLALEHEGWHLAQHLSFLLSALVFWSAMLQERHQRAGIAALCLFATSLLGGALGALMAFAQSPWYPGYAALGLTPFGLTAHEDQQLAGLLMWIPGGLVHAGAALLMFRRVLRVLAPASLNGNEVLRSR
jgi:putative membrane protein